MSDWISVDFALPAKFGKYMVFDRCFYFAWFHRYKNGKIKWSASPGFERLSSVSHWQPLPESPKHE